MFRSQIHSSAAGREFPLADALGAPSRGTDGGADRALINVERMPEDNDDGLLSSLGPSNAVSSLIVGSIEFARFVSRLFSIVASLRSELALAACARTAFWAPPGLNEASPVKWMNEKLGVSSLRLDLRRLGRGLLSSSSFFEEGEFSSCLSAIDGCCQERNEITQTQHPGNCGGTPVSYVNEKQTSARSCCQVVLKD